MMDTYYTTLYCSTLIKTVMAWIVETKLNKFQSEKHFVSSSLHYDQG